MNDTFICSNEVKQNIFSWYSIMYRLIIW